MESAFTNNNRSAARYKGIINLSFFGALWLIFPITQALNTLKLPLILWLIMYIALIIFSVIKLRQLKLNETDRSNERMILKRFNVVVSLQWIAIFASFGLLNVLSLQAFVAYTVVLIVGLHFFPLAKLFRESAYYFTGVAMNLVGAGAIISGALRNTQVEVWPFLSSSIVLFITVVYILNLQYKSQSK